LPDPDDALAELPQGIAVAGLLKQVRLDCMVLAVVRQTQHQVTELVQKVLLLLRTQQQPLTATFS
jgi:hypothetical protein